MSWTEERVELLKKMWAEGASASQIAKELGGVTRNAVIGKVHRLGLSNRAAAAAAAEDPAPAATAAPAVAPAEAEASAETAKSPAAEPAATEAPAPPPAEEAAPDPASAAAAPESPNPASPTPTPPRRQIIPAGQPLPPQPSANEIDPAALAKVRKVEQQALKLSLMELTERTCKWPVGDPATEDFWFCGLPSQPGKPYCEAHVAVAYQPMSARRDRRR